MRKSENRMAIFIRMLLALSLTCTSVCKAEEKDHWAMVKGIKNRADRVKIQSAHEKDFVEETLMERKRISLSLSERTDSVTMMNNLRRTVGSSNMPYMTYNVDEENIAASWTYFCNYDGAVNSANFANGFKYITADPLTITAVIKKLYQLFPTEMSSVYLTSFGCNIEQCSVATADGVTWQNAQLGLCLFQGDQSAYDDTIVQYTLGEGCTECNSGSFWCDYGLCRDNCAPSDSCYCNSNCLNCASTYPTTCRCQCLQGWIGSRCGTQSSVNPTTPICSTTARSPKRLTTISLTDNTAPTPFSTSFLQTVLFVVVALFLRA